jgi:hypothetical protein
VKHLYSNECYDEAQVWCGDEDYYRDRIQPVRDPSQADCKACLEAAAKFGSCAQERFRMLRPNLGKCPYVTHASDCDCGGEGGNR